MPAVTLLKNNVLNYNFGNISYLPVLPATMYFGLSTETIPQLDTLSTIPEGLSYTGTGVTLTMFNTYSIGDKINVSGVDAYYGTTNIDGTWTIGGAFTTYIQFVVDSPPTGTTPQYISGGLVCKIPPEPSGGNYSRPSYSNNKTTWGVSTAGKLSSAIPIEFPTASADWGDIFSIFIADAATFGNIFWYCNFNVDFFVGTSSTPPYTDVVFDIGSIVVTI